MDRVELGLSGENFEYFFQDVERILRDYPRVGSVAVPGGQGILMRATLDAFPDIPPLYIYYRVKENPNAIRFFGLSPAWSEAETL